MKFIAILSTVLLTSSVSARKHRYCACGVNGILHDDLSEATCTQWGQTNPNTEWDSEAYACKDFHGNGGIDGKPWENTCKQVYIFAFGGSPDSVKGSCWN